MHTSSQSIQPPIRHWLHSQGNGANGPARCLSPDKTVLPQSGGMAIFQTLLADGNALFRRFLRDILVRRFPSMLIAEAGNGDHALELNAELHPQLVFMDIKLPDRSGLDLTKQFKSSNPGVLIYLVAQYDIPEYRAAAQECGADQVIFMGESSEAAIVSMLEAALSGHCRMPRIGETEDLRVPEECMPDLPG